MSGARGWVQRSLVTALIEHGYVELESARVDVSVINLVHRIRRGGFNVSLDPIEAPDTDEASGWYLRLHGQLSDAERAVFLGGDPEMAARVWSAFERCGAEPTVALVRTVYAVLSAAAAPNPAGGDRLVALRASAATDRAVVTAILVHDVEAPRAVAVQQQADATARAVDQVDATRRALLAADNTSDRGLTRMEVLELRKRQRGAEDEWFEASQALDAVLGHC